MRREVSLFRFAGAAAALALLTTSLAGPALAAPSPTPGFGSLDRDLSQAQWQKPGQGKPGWKPGPGHGPSGGHWHHGGGGHWRNGVWVPALAFGVLGAAAAAAAFGAPPQPGMCWYYDDPFQTTGHWDYC
ncbi:MAG TPA: hypothetical protein VKV96_04485 [Roseiarcus sp.]|nr:hypothetical protein [Roseiarcus sp.]